QQRVLRQRRMTTREDKTQAIVLRAIEVEIGREGLLRSAVKALGNLDLRSVEARTPSNGIDRLERAGRDEPRARVVRHAVARPLLDRSPERVVQGLLCVIEVAEQPDQRREHATRLSTVDVLDQRGQRLGAVALLASHYDRSASTRVLDARNGPPRCQTTSRAAIAVRSFSSSSKSKIARSSRMCFSLCVPVNGTTPSCVRNRK